MNNIRRWWLFNKWHIIWKKELYSDTFDDLHNKRSITFKVYRTFSISQGFGYLIQTPDILINKKKLWVAIDVLIKYMYKKCK